MQKIKRCSVLDSISEPCIIVGEPSDVLLQLQKEGHLVICELTHLQGKSEAEIEEALQKEEAIWQYQHICIDVSALPEAYFERIWYRHKNLPVQIAETKRLLIRESIPKDAEAFVKMYADKEVRRFLELPALEKELDEKTYAEKVAAYEDYIEQYSRNQYGFYEYGMWSVVEKESGKVIGRMGLELQKISTGEEKIALGYALLPEYRGYGYAYEACLAILEYNVICGYADELLVKIDENNTKSKHLLQKLREYDKVVLNNI